MKNYQNIICILCLFSALLAEVDSAKEVTNEKFSFINNIYSEWPAPQKLYQVLS